MIWFKKKRIELGEGHIIQYTLFESKFFGGIWVYNWKTILQNRFHTHAFSSYAFLLNGAYTEEVIHDGKIGGINFRRNILWRTFNICI